MVSIKVCGITRPQDAISCLELGVDAIGFIFYPPSPRYVDPQRAREVISALQEAGFLPPRQGSIFNASRRPAICGVFVNEEVEVVKSLVHFCGLDFIQLHGQESPAYVRKFPPSMVIKNFPLRAPEDLATLKEYRIHAALVDAYVPHLPGGTGKTANWRLAREVKKCFPLILSGGLNEKNMRDALRKVAPDAVDVNSGVEISPGLKDKEKIREIVSIVHEAYGLFRT